MQTCPSGKTCSSGQCVSPQNGQCKNPLPSGSTTLNSSTACQVGSYGSYSANSPTNGDQWVCSGSAGGTNATCRRCDDATLIYGTAKAAYCGTGTNSNKVYSKGVNTCTLSVQTCPAGQTCSNGSCSSSPSYCVTDLGTLSASVSRADSWSTACPSHTNTSHYADYYTFTLSSSETVTIDIESPTDSYLHLYNYSSSPDHKAGSEITHDDDGGDGTNARISSQSLSAAQYTIQARPYSAETTDSYTLLISFPDTESGTGCCYSETNSNCYLPDGAEGDTAGSCTGTGVTGSCSYTCSSCSWSYLSNSCTVPCSSTCDCTSSPASWTETDASTINCGTTHTETCNKGRNSCGNETSCSGTAATVTGTKCTGSNQTCTNTNGVWDCEEGRDSPSGGGCTSHDDCDYSEYCTACTASNSCTGSGTCEVCTLSDTYCNNANTNIIRTCKVEGEVKHRFIYEQCSQGCNRGFFTHHCIECGTDSQCSGGTPYCADRKCYACTESSHCPGTDPICFLGICVGCTEDSHCSEPTPYCGTIGNLGVCQACTSDSHCSSPTPYCSTSSGACQACTSDTHCSSETPHCRSNGRCAECEEDSHCPSTAPYCKSNGLCAQCESNSDCSGATPYCRYGSCAECNNDFQCSDPTKTYCNYGICSVCSDHSHCSGATPYCRSRSCAQCLTDAQCLVNQTCSDQGSCVDE